MESNQPVQSKPWYLNPLVFIPILLGGGGVGGFIIAALTLSTSSCQHREKMSQADKQFDKLQDNRKEDQDRRDREKQQEEKRNRPHLKLIGQIEESDDGFTRITLRNNSPTEQVVIGSIMFVISDPEALAIVERVYPKIPPTMQVTITERELRLVKHAWNQDLQSFYFYVHPKFVFEPKQPIEIVTCIINRDLPQHKFTGKLYIDVDDGDCEDLPEMKIRSFKDPNKRPKPSPKN